MLKASTLEILNQFVRRYPELSPMQTALEQSVEQMKQTYECHGKILVCGNGGSASDSLHIVGELMKSFSIPRPLPDTLQNKLKADHPEFASLYTANLQSCIPAISLVNEVSLMTAYGNDQDSQLVFAQQVLGYGAPGDILFAISTSGNSANVLHAARVAKSMGLKIVALTGESGGQLKAYADILLAVPSAVTHQIQELHLPVYHLLCLAIEHELFAVEKGEV